MIQEKQSQADKNSYLQLLDRLNDIDSKIMQFNIENKKSLINLEEKINKEILDKVKPLENEVQLLRNHMRVNSASHENNILLENKDLKGKNASLEGIINDLEKRCNLLVNFVKKHPDSELSPKSSHVRFVQELQTTPIKNML